jgi:hypothetical protein
MPRMRAQLYLVLGVSQIFLRTVDSNSSHHFGEQYWFYKRLFSTRFREISKFSDFQFLFFSASSQMDSSQKLINVNFLKWFFQPNYHNSFV